MKYEKYVDNRKKKRPYNDLSGQRFNKLTVLYRSTDEVQGNKVLVRYACMCDCGKEVLVRGTRLTSGLAISCGCSRRENLIGKNLIDLTGEQFGYWSVIERAPSRVHETGKADTRWFCECICGTKRMLRAGALTSGSSTSCGCKTEPLMEIYTREYLKGKCIKFESQKKFDSLTGVGGRLLSYDFVIYDDNDNIVCLLECQGKQHFETVDWFGGDEGLRLRQEHDGRKKEFAHNNNILLIEMIPDTVN